MRITTTGRWLRRGTLPVAAAGMFALAACGGGGSSGSAPSAGTGTGGSAGTT